MDLQTLLNAQAELDRFQIKLKSATKAIKENQYYQGKETGALKRAAMDLKTELHKITSK